ncbi:MAG: TIR domain-containing protein [Anaerolineae bacterium]
MAKGTILFADNDLHFLKTRAEFLEQEGYLVVPATNVTEARRKLEIGGIDLAIIDIRLEDDDDEKDTSGLVLARDVARSVPKIILTGFPSYEYVREALRPQLDGLSAAVDFVTKQEGPEAMLAAVERFLLKEESAHQRVFIVHGHDEAAKQTVGRFIEKLGLHAIILREQPHAGRTIIEHMEKHSNVGFAVVLLTIDDIGGPKGTKLKGLKPRARQNVIFELGFFVGKLGRNRVCVLYKEGVEIPSDYHGILYVPMDPNGGWKGSLAKEIKEAGIPFDLDRILKG